MMLWFDRLFPVLMLLFPALFTLFVKVQPGGDETRARQLAAGLWMATLVGLALHAGVQIAHETTGSIPVHLHRAWIVVFPMIGFMLLWFGLAGRVLAARHPGWRNTNDETRTTRAASLAPRHEDVPEPQGLLLAGWCLYGLCVAATAWAIWESGNPLPILGLMFWPCFVWGAKASRLEPEPMDVSGSPELEAEYAAFRRFRSSGFVLCGMAGGLLFAGTAVLMVLRPEWAGFVGGVGGASVGIIGGVFGSLASVRRARIQSRLRDLESGANGC
jgi:hypothetical protein